MSAILRTGDLPVSGPDIYLPSSQDDADLFVDIRCTASAIGWPLMLDSAIYFQFSQLRSM